MTNIFTAEKAKSFVARLKREATAHREPKKMNDVADPYVTIRKLIQLVESLQAELKTRDPSDELLKEMELLRVENGNLYIVQGRVPRTEEEAVRRRAAGLGESRTQGATERRRGAIASPSPRGDHRFPSEITAAHGRRGPRRNARARWIRVGRAVSPEPDESDAYQTGNRGDEGRAKHLIDRRGAYPC